MRYTISLFCCILLWTSCEKAFEAEPQNHPVALFDNLWTTFDESYGPFSERNINWEALYNEYRPQVNATTTDEELFNIMATMLAHLNDGHVNLTAPGRKTFNANLLRNQNVDDSLFNLNVIKEHYLNPGFNALSDNGYVYGTLQGTNLGYIYFDYVSDNFFIMNEFLNQHQTSDGIIIDLRHNQGGDFTYCFSEIGRLTDQTRMVFESRTKNGPGATDYTPWHTWSIHPDGQYFNKPIVVLTDRYTISAGERAVMAFMTLPNATIVGDTTSGAHSTAIGRELANGWYYSIATQNTKLFDGQSYEGIGLAPDILFKNIQTDVNTGVDKTLEKAIEILE